MLQAQSRERSSGMSGGALLYMVDSLRALRENERLTSPFFQVCRDRRRTDSAPDGWSPATSAASPITSRASGSLALFTTTSLSRHRPNKSRTGVPYVLEQTTLPEQRSHRASADDHAATLSSPAGRWKEHDASARALTGNAGPEGGDSDRLRARTHRETTLMSSHRPIFRFRSWDAIDQFGSPPHYPRGRST